MEPEINTYRALPSSGAGPGILVLHAWWGLNDFIKDFCQRLALEGFVALAPDLYHGQVVHTIPEAKRLRSKLSQGQVKADILAGAEQLRGLRAVTGTSLGVIGFSLGGSWALWLSLERPEYVTAVTVFYAAKSDDYSAARAAYMGHFAETDEWVAASGVRKLEKSLRAAQRPVAFYTYKDTGHWFFEQDRADAYNEKAAKLAWNRTVEFMHSQLYHRSS